MIFEIPGPPQGKGRPRFAQRANGSAVIYTPTATATYEERIRIEYRRQCRGAMFPPGVPLAVRITAEMPIPARASKKARAEMLSGAAKPLVKPDADNVAKIVLDALNGVAYPDDRAIVALHVQKKYSDTPRVVVEIEAETI